MVKELISERNITLEIIDYNSSGRGLGKIDGKVVFLDSGVIGDTVEVKILKEKKNFSEGKIIKVIKNSLNRIKSPCPYSIKCGGCDFLEFSYDKQLEWKSELVKSNVKKISNISVNVQNTIGMENPFYYRNNMQFKHKDNKIGLYEKSSKTIVEIDNCLIQSKYSNKILQALQGIKIPEKVKTIAIRSTSLNETMAIFVTSEPIKKYNSIISSLINVGISSIYENINKSDKYHFGTKFKKIYGEDFLSEVIFKNKYKLYPGSFMQVNKSQMEILYSEAIDFLELKIEDNLLDLYCGMGTISLSCADKVNKVVGIESNQGSIDSARENAEINNISNCEFIAGKSEDVIEKILDTSSIYFNKVVLDPPRAGCDEKVLRGIMNISPEKIVYISCDSATLSRDLKILCEEKYEVKKVQPVDMFCHSSHVETVVLLEKI